MHEDEDGRMVLTKDLDGAGTVTHQAPELFRENDKAGASVDMFALGIMVSVGGGRVGYHGEEHIQYEDIQSPE